MSTWRVQMPTILITGGHGGIGLECVKHVAAKKYDLVLLGRNVSRMDEVAEDLRANFAVKVSPIQVDLGSLASVREAACRCLSLIESGEIAGLQAVLCNAGATFRGEPTYTEDGYELTFTTNYLGHFLLVQLLLDALDREGRIVFTASGTHDPDTADGRFIGRATKPVAEVLAKAGLDGHPPLTGGERYTTSKLCVILHCYELDRRLRAAGRGITTIAYDPGAIAETGLLRDLPGAARAMIGSRVMRWLMRRFGLTLGDLEQSGRALADLATATAYGSGCYYQWQDGALVERRSAAMSYDLELARDLWAESKRLSRLGQDEEPGMLL
ncbi:SDR family NAD(P)-dependent oxidoreductase [Paroceanicella profunda]|uniref:SDR family NAD(P)-dependent oxidoreductase n=2 Tax=Paroceanicella profunda TaxID=2579971 RepID=A0A5B8G0B0_9RHOB|nr:SDR family NAD(P)-dependent oxidoreductase [Paroceanicella profunda]